MFQAALETIEKPFVCRMFSPSERAMGALEGPWGVGGGGLGSPSGSFGVHEKSEASKRGSLGGL